MTPQLRNNPYVVETAGLTKRFGDRVAVADVDLRIPAGSAFGYLGPNGAGKTTLIRMLLGLTDVSSGTMRLLGREVPAHRAEALARVGAIVEEPRFHGFMTGPENLEIMAKLVKVPEFRDGLRVTDAETVDIARMVLRGQVNPSIVAAINVHAPIAVGVSGEDARLISATARSPDLGFVGDVGAVNPELLDRLLSESLVPVVATTGADVAGQAYNINADTVAGVVAEALDAEKLVYLTDIEGLRRDVDDAASLIRQTTADELDALISDGTIAGGMIPKVSACVHAVRNGVGRAHILDGRIAHVLLLEIFTDAGIGTMIVGGTR